jgi:hypothetical protein
MSRGRGADRLRDRPERMKAKPPGCGSNPAASALREKQKCCFT